MCVCVEKEWSRYKLSRRDGKDLAEELDSSFNLDKAVVYIAEAAICPPLPCSVPNLQSDGKSQLAVELNSSFELAKPVVYTAEAAYALP